MIHIISNAVIISSSPSQKFIFNKMSQDIPDFISQKDCITTPRGSCFDLLVKINGIYAAFVYEDNIKLDRSKYGHLLMNTWENDKMVFFIGVTTHPTDGYIWIANCKCILGAFVARKKWPTRLYDNDQWHHCKDIKCDSVFCNECHTGEEECIFPHKTRVIYSGYNDTKKRDRIQKKIDKDTRSCSECKITLKQFKQEKPYCKPFSWTPVPKTTGKL